MDDAFDDQDDQDDQDVPDTGAGLHDTGAGFGEDHDVPGRDARDAGSLHGEPARGAHAFDLPADLPRRPRCVLFLKTAGDPPPTEVLVALETG